MYIYIIYAYITSITLMFIYIYIYICIYHLYGTNIRSAYYVIVGKETATNSACMLPGQMIHLKALMHDDLHLFH